MFLLSHSSHTLQWRFYSLSYASTMEVLETAKVDAYSTNDVIIPAARRSQVLCLVWEGTCTERTPGSTKRSHRDLNPIDEEHEEDAKAIWFAGDWTGPISLQPDRRLSGESESSLSHDVVAVSNEGVKVITVEFSSLHVILKSGSLLYRKYLERKAHQERVKIMDGSQSARASQNTTSAATDQLFDDAMRDLNVLELLNCNSALRKLNAVQKRHLESLAEGPVSFQPGERLWRAGAPVDRAFLIVSGTASFVPKRRHAGSAAAGHNIKEPDIGDPSLGDSMRLDAMKAIKELGVHSHHQAVGGDESSMSSVEESHGERIIQHIHFDSLFNRALSAESTAVPADVHDFEKLSRGLQKRAEYLQKEGSKDGSVCSGHSNDESDDVDSFDCETESQLDYTFTTDEADPGARSRRTSVIRRRSSRARFANKVLGRLYSRRAFTGGLVFSRGHFLGDVSKMVAGLLSADPGSDLNEDFGHAYGFGDKSEGQSDNLVTISELVIHEQEGDHHIMHSSTLTAGKTGCVVLLFPKAALIPFLDDYPGLLLSLLGTQVVV
jgi:hypothetical protein